VDLRPGNVETLRKLGIGAHCAPVETLRFATPFHVISMMDVLEHVPYPATTLAAVRDNLAEGGCVLLSMPNRETVLWTLMTQQNANPYLGEIEHYHNFSRTRLYALLRQTGLEPLRYGISERYRACMEVVARKPACA
jgi:2-polyprenyl-3-methyl-5-hydroxy-6-metoxy-1,4-benzoquinol methylase